MRGTPSPDPQLPALTPPRPRHCPLRGNPGVRAPRLSPPAPGRPWASGHSPPGWPGRLRRSRARVPAPGSPRPAPPRTQARPPAPAAAPRPRALLDRPCHPRRPEQDPGVQPGLCPPPQDQDRALPAGGLLAAGFSPRARAPGGFFCNGGNGGGREGGSRSWSLHPPPGSQSPQPECAAIAGITAAAVLGAARTFPAASGGIGAGIRLLVQRSGSRFSCGRAGSGGLGWGCPPRPGALGAPPRGLWGGKGARDPGRAPPIPAPAATICPGSGCSPGTRGGARP